MYLYRPEGPYCHTATEMSKSYVSLSISLAKLMCFVCIKIEGHIHWTVCKKWYIHVYSISLTLPHKPNEIHRLEIQWTNRTLEKESVPDGLLIVKN